MLVPEKLPQLHHRLFQPLGGLDEAPLAEEKDTQLGHAAGGIRMVLREQTAADRKLAPDQLEPLRMSAGRVGGLHLASGPIRPGQLVALLRRQIDRERHGADVPLRLVALPLLRLGIAAPVSEQTARRNERLLEATLSAQVFEGVFQVFGAGVGWDQCAGSLTSSRGRMDH